jgi:hypothetical protein
MTTMARRAGKGATVARIERSEIRDRPLLMAALPRVSLALNPGYS